LKLSLHKPVWSKGKRNFGGGRLKNIAGIGRNPANLAVKGVTGNTRAPEGQ